MSKYAKRCQMLEIDMDVLQVSMHKPIRLLQCFY